MGQVRLCLKYWNGDIQLPSRDEMLKQTAEEMEARKAKGIAFRVLHLLGDYQVTNDLF